MKTVKLTDEHFAAHSLSIYIYYLGLAFESAGFRPSFENLACLATLKSCDTMKQSVYGWQHMLPYPRGVELSSEGRNGYHSSLARFFEWIELSVAIKQIYVNINKCDT